MAAKRHFKGSYKREPKKWGDIITADHLVTNRKGRKQGVHKFKNALNLKDLWSGLIASVPVKDKGQAECAWEINFLPATAKFNGFTPITRES